MAREEYYHSTTGGRRPASRGPLMWLLDTTLTLVSGAVVVMMLLLLLVPRIDPAYTWALPMLGLVAPGIYLLVLVLTLYWVVRWRLKRAAVMGMMALIGAFSVSLFWRPASHRASLLEKQIEQVDAQLTEEQDARKVGDLKKKRRLLLRNLQAGDGWMVMSYNLRAFYGDDGENSADGVAALVDSLRPDILCLQEWQVWLADKSEPMQQLLENYRSADFGLAKVTVRPQMIFAHKRHRILRSGVITTPRTSVWADVRMGDDTIRIVSNHLQSTGITSLDNAYITGYEYLLDTAREEKLRSIVARVHENCVVRADQVDSIRRHIDHEAPRLRIVCGDFNDTPISYAYRKLARGMQDAFSECGSGYSYTFRGFFNALRIDYVLLSEGLEPHSYEVPRVNLSDHLPVVVRFKRQTTYP